MKCRLSYRKESLQLSSFVQEFRREKRDEAVCPL